MSEPLSRVFIGSSSEGLEVARHLGVELSPDLCEVVPWNRDVFEPSGYALDSLIATANSVDFAVLVATPDDTSLVRGIGSHAARDNVVLEFGLFAGALGRQRTYLLATGEIRLPTDVLGLTRLAYRRQATGRAAVAEAALQIETQVRSRGRLARHSATAPGAGHPSALDRELDLLCTNAVAQGWAVKTNSPTTLRLRSPRGKTFTLSKSQPVATREELRQFAVRLRGGGLRVNSSVRRPVAESPF